LVQLTPFRLTALVRWLPSESDKIAFFHLTITG
jgi:hypothetical protein